VVLIVAHPLSTAGLMRLRYLIIWDERVRPRPRVTLPGRHAGIDGHLRETPPPSPAELPVSQPVPIAAVITAVAARFGQPADALVGPQPAGRERHIATAVVQYLAKTLTSDGYRTLARELHVAHTTVRLGVVKVEHLRAVDSALAHAIAEIEAELGGGAGDQPCPSSRRGPIYAA
jgi:hypothetical protein